MTTPVRVKYQTIEVGTTDIHLCTLRDKQQFSDPDDIAKNFGINDSLWPLFGVVWPSSIVLANYMCDYPVTGKRILEVGCGIALTSLMLNKKNADISASDYHPEVDHFLKRNAKLNESEVINYERTDWKDGADTLGRFDLIVGSDILYEDQHTRLLTTFIENHSNLSCEVVIVDPGRGRKNKLSKLMADYGFKSEQIKPDTFYLDQPFKGHILRYWRIGEATKYRS